MSRLGQKVTIDIHAYNLLTTAMSSTLHALGFFFDENDLIIDREMKKK